MKRIVLAASLALITAPALAQEATISRHDDGGIGIDAPMSALGTVSDGLLQPDEEMVRQIVLELAGDADVDYAEGHVLPGPVRLSLTRDDGSVAFFDIAGDVVAFDAEETYFATGSNWTLRGVAVFEAPGGELRAEFGSMAFISVD